MTCSRAGSLIRTWRRRLLEEARWGLDWVMKTSFGNGMRLLRAPYCVYTDNKIGTIDDILTEYVGNDPFTNIISAGVKGYASRLLKSMDSGFSSLLLKSAEEDFAAYIKARKEPPVGDEAEFSRQNQGRWKDELGYGAFAAVQMYLSTGNKEYKDHAVRFARDLLAQQEQTFVDGTTVTGYFYAGPERKHIVQDFHSSFEESGLFALKALCEALPGSSGLDKMVRRISCSIQSISFVRIEDNGTVRVDPGSGVSSGGSRCFGISFAREHVWFSDLQTKSRNIQRTHSGDL